MDFNKVTEANKQNIKNIIRLITKEDNEDLEQEVYVKIWKNSDKYQEKGSIKSWISTIARNTSLDYLKSTYHKVFQTSTSEDLVITNIRDKKISPEDTFAKKERQRKIDLLRYQVEEIEQANQRDLNHENVYMIDSGKIWLWFGAKSLFEMRNFAVQFALQYAKMKGQEKTE